MNWHLQDAKNHLSKVVRKALTEGPQTITLRGHPAVVVVSKAEYDRSRPTSAPDKPNFIEHLLSGPEWPDEMIEAVNRRSHTSREIDL
jgi:prevent-host-death family protein